MDLVQNAVYMIMAFNVHVHKECLVIHLHLALNIQNLVIVIANATIINVIAFQNAQHRVIVLAVNFAKKEFAEQNVTQANVQQVNYVAEACVLTVVE